ncbi:MULTISPECIES: hypothetical protein [unclassified Acinetobacter]|uniref:hypothetical protein n=3 Tax=Acinetobacter TaxID=469 RepID=UPI0015D2E5B4|nr:MULTISPECIES: hypothetical protein [unclassified Acinetobacter]
MLRNISIGAIVLFSLYGCSSSAPLRNQPYKSMSPSEFQRYLDEDTQNKSQASLPQPQIENETWADTQKAKCKIYASPLFKKNDPTVRFYWDGECKDGYAIGLGREFSIGKQTYVEAIGEYKGGEKRPQYFYQFDKVNKMFQIGDLENSPKNRLLFQGMLDNNNVFKKSIIFHDYDHKEMYEKMSFDDAGAQGRFYASVGGLNVTEQSYTSDPLLKQQLVVQMQKKKLYTFESFNDGRKNFVDLSSNSPVLVNPSQNLQDFVTNKIFYLDNKFSNPNDFDLKKTLDAETKVNTYINLTCTSSNYIKEVGKDNYFAICSPYKSLGVFKNQIEQGKEFVNQQKQKRLADVQQYIANQQLQAQQAEQLRLAQQQKAQEGWTALFNAITEVSNGVANSYNQQAEMYKNFSNNMPVQSFPTLNRQKATYNCINIGVNTTCREQ